MATEEGKPDGLTWWKPQSIPAVYKYLPCQHTRHRFTQRSSAQQKWDIHPRRFGFNTEACNQNLMGILGEYYQKIAQVLMNTSYYPGATFKSITRSVTLDASTLSPLVVEAVGRLLCDSLSKGLEEINSRAKELFMFLRYDDMSAESTGMKLEFYTNDPDVIFHNFKMLNKELRPYKQGVRLVGVGMTDIRQHYTPSLFYQENQSIKAVVERYASAMVTTASYLLICSCRALHQHYCRVTKSEAKYVHIDVLSHFRIRLFIMYAGGGRFWTWALHKTSRRLRITGTAWK